MDAQVPIHQPYQALVVRRLYTTLIVSACADRSIMSFTVSAMIRGYHVYKEVWNAEVNEELRCEREVGNRSDTFAVAVKKGTVTGGGPCATNYIVNLFHFYTKGR